MSAPASEGLARHYLIGRFHPDASSTGPVPLGSGSAGSPRGEPWNGIAIAVFLQTGSK